MKSIILIILFTVGLVIVAQALPSCYHTYAEIGTELQQLENTYPSIAKLYVIGHSQLDNLPIYAMKISDNVNNEEAEPAVLFIGQVHAEEVLGVETTMRNINEILQSSYQMPYGSWISQLEMWFIPTLNPEGHKVVSDNLDATFRKNKNDVNNNGIFDYSPLVGYDIDGVDINRNFIFNWCHGDTLWQPPSSSSPEPYDYYRGSAPMSESENQALKAFCDMQKPVFCIVWHSARTISSSGASLNEKVFYPLNWATVRPAPDLVLGQQIGEGVAGQIRKEGTLGTYEPSAASGRKGGINDWMYQQYGTICLIVECGKAPNIQPDDSLMTDTNIRCTLGAWWLLNRALPLSSEVESNSMLTGTIRNAVTNAPLEAEVIVEQKHAPWFAPRKSDPVLGRYWRPIYNGNYTIRYRKKGYWDSVYTNHPVYSGSWTILNVNMQPISPAIISGTVTNSQNGQLIPATVTLFDVDNETQITNGEFVFNSFQGGHRIEITSEGFYPYIDTLVVNQGVQNLHVNFVLTPVSIAFSETWENGTGNWTVAGPWLIQNQLAADGNAITDSWGGRGFYAENCNVWIKTNNPVSIPSVGQKMLTFDEHLYTEFVYDSVRVEISTDNSNWQTIYSNSGQYDWWHPVFIPLNQYSGQSLYFRFRLTDHSTEVDLTDPGWTIDNIKVISGIATATPNNEETLDIMPVTVLYPNFPNPFNPETSIKFSTSHEDKVQIDIYNLKGQKIKQLTNELYKSGTHTLKWNGLDDNNKSVSSGIYFCKMQSSNKTQILKMVLMK
jgi:hypothetical protein